MAPPAVAATLLQRAIEANPESEGLRLKLAQLDLDRYAYSDAAAGFEAAIRLAPELPSAHVNLAHCHNALGRPREAIAVLDALATPEYERARAYDALGMAVEAEAELRRVLASNPHHRRSCRMLGKHLRRSGRMAELLAICEDLAARGARHAQLFYTWSTALALAGEHELAAALLFDRDRVVELPLPVPAGFDSIDDFNAALAEELLGNPYRLSEFPQDDEANRGSSRVHALFAGRRPELVEALLEALQAHAETLRPTRYGTFDPWLDARPARAQLKAWGLIQRGGEYEAWHHHPAGWISGVYYVRIPRGASAAGKGPACIEFGPPTALERARPGYRSTWRHLPREGHLLLAPSHYAHRTIPSGLDEYRISFAFDVVPREELWSPDAEPASVAAFDERG